MYCCGWLSQVMAMNNEILTREAIQSLTGYKQRCKQRDWLARAGIWFEPDRNGDPRTTWYHVNNPLTLRRETMQSLELSTPDFGAITNGRKAKKTR
ncbi:DUF4224 domain-containing protein [Salmonella enterica]|nr:DUF4224 domain-containing protein [Salmonella enterica]